VPFTGIWLVLAMYLQHGLGYSPLRSGLAVTPFALGVATSAALAGRLVARFGRWLTVCGLTATVFGLVVTALLLGRVIGDAAAWAAALPLLVAGLGGGMVTSPNITLTLEHVPVAMAGVAGGALQTAQRIGSAVGTAVLATIFYHLLGRGGNDYPTAVRDTVLAASALMVLALLLAVADLAGHHRRTSREAVGPAATHPGLAVPSGSLQQTAVRGDRRQVGPLAAADLDEVQDMRLGVDRQQLGRAVDVKRLTYQRST
jgi:MFS family permease